MKKLLLILATLLFVITGMMAQTVDIEINATTCADFEVLLEPSVNINSTLTNIQFTVKWDVSTPNTSLISASSSFVSQQGTTAQSGGYNYATFVGIDKNINWTGSQQYEILTFSIDLAGTGIADFVIMPDGDDYESLSTVFYIELLGSDITGDITNNADGVDLGLPTITLGSNPSVCQGLTTADLSYSATTFSPNQYSIDYDGTAQGEGFEDVTYASLPSTPIVLVVPAGATPGTYNATLTVSKSANGCESNSYNITVTVNALPTPTYTIEPGADVCMGVDVTYTTQSSQTNYNWTVPGVLNTDYSITSGGIGTTNYTVTLKWLTAGSKTVTVNYTNGNGCTGASPASNTFTVTPNASAGTVTAGTSPQCIGGTTTYTVSGVELGGGTGGWSSSNPLVATVDAAGLVTAIGAGTCNIIYTVTGGCNGTPTASQPFTVTPNASAGTVTAGTSPQCIGGTTTYTVSGVELGGGTGGWSSSNPLVATVDAAGLVTAIGAGTCNIIYTVTGGCNGTPTASQPFTVTPNASAGTVTAGTSPQCIGGTTTYTVSGVELGGGTGGWSSSNPLVATVDAAGLVTAIGAGTCNIIYTVTGGCNGTPTASQPFTVTPNASAGTVTAGTSPQCIGGTTTYTVSGVELGGGTGGWSSSNPLVATVDAAGLVTAIGAGTCNIIYTVTGGCNGTPTASQPFTVTPNASAGTVTAGTSPQCIGGTTTYTVSGVELGGGTGGWSSSNPLVATVDAAGLVTAIGAGTCNIIYTVTGGCNGTPTASQPFTVTPNASAGTVTAGTSPQCIGGTTTYTVSGVELGGGTGGWSSSNPLVATVDAAGLVTAIGAGTCNIIYTVTGGCNGTPTASQPFTVTPNASAGTVTAGTSPQCIGGTTTYTVSGVELGGGTGGWSSSNPLVATVDAAGLVTAIGAGTCNIIYTVTGGCNGTPTASQPFTVTPNASAGTVTAGTSPQCIGGTTTYTVSGVELGGGTGGWSSSNPLVATVDAAGLVTAIGAGTCNIIYTVTGGCNGTPTASQPFTVTPNASAGTVTAGTSPQCIGGTTTYTVSGVELGGGTGGWSSSNPLVATVDAAGLVTAIGAGTCNIIYTVTGGCNGTPTASQPFTVTPNASAGTVTAGTSPQCIGGTTTYTVSGVELGGGTGGWSSSNPLVATVDAAGLVTAIGAGTCNIIYTVTGGCNGTPTASQPFTVTPNASAGTVTAGTSPQCIGGTTTYTVSGVELGGGTGGWSSSNPLVATVDAAGLVTAIGAGTCNIIYTVTGGCNGTPTASQPFTVTPNASAGTVTAGTSPQCIGGTTTYTVSGVELGGGTGGWSSSNPLVATVDAAGLVTAIGAGTCNIIYTVTGGCNGTPTASQPFTVYDNFTSGEIASTGEAICYGCDPGVIASQTDASGGDESITYKWEYSLDGFATAGILIVGAGSATYDPPAGLQATTSYRRYAHDGTCNTSFEVSTGTWVVTISEAAALLWLQSNTFLTSVSGTIADLNAEFPDVIPPVIVNLPYQINSRITLADELPTGSTITISRDGVVEVSNLALTGAGPFWYTELLGYPLSVAAPFDANYGGSEEDYVITITGPGNNPFVFETTVYIESIISKDGFLTNTVLDDITLDAVIPPVETAALLWLQQNTFLTSVSGTIADLNAEFPDVIPPVIVNLPYQINSRITLADELPTGSTITISRDGVVEVSNLALTGAGPFWYTELLGYPLSVAAPFDANYGGSEEDYVITITGPGNNPFVFETTVYIESIISKDGFLTNTVLDDITLDAVIPPVETAALLWLQQNTFLTSVSGTIADLNAEFPDVIPPVIVNLPYQINSRITLADELPTGSTITISRDGVVEVSNLALTGAGPFWYTELLGYPLSVAAPFDANYGGSEEDYVITITGPGNNPFVFETTVYIESIISKDGFLTNTVLDDITLDAVIPPVETAALLWLQQNTFLTSVSGTIADLNAEFPDVIPPVIVNLPYQINSRITLADELPTGSTITISRDGVVEVSNLALTGAGPFWYTELLGYPLSVAAPFDANYGGSEEDYVITITGPGNNPFVFETTVYIESIISKDGFLTNTVLDDITLDAVIPPVETAALLWLQQNTFLTSVSGTIADLNAEFPDVIPPVIVNLPYQINSRITLADELPTGSTITISRDGVVEVSNLALTGAGPFWYTELLGYPLSVAAPFDANYGGSEEDYVITITGPGNNPFVFETTVYIESIISKDGFLTNTVLDDITLDAVIPPVETAALLWLQQNTFLTSVSGTIADLNAEFPDVIPPVIVNLPYQINSRITLADELPTGSTITISRDGVVEVSNLALTGAGPFWYTELLGYPLSVAAPFDANYGGSEEDYVITITGPGNNPFVFETTVYIESIISKDGFLTNTVLDDITLDAVIPPVETAALLWLQQNTFLTSVSGTIADLNAEFPDVIPPVIVNLPYQINSRITLADELPTGSTITISRDGVVEVSNLALTGAGPFWYTELLGYPLSVAAPFDANYGGSEEDYVITITGPGNNPLVFETTVYIESIISKDIFVSNFTVLDDITLDATIPPVPSSLKVWLQGPYNATSGEMETTLNDEIPLSQPYNVAPWNYYETESVTTMPEDAVDWVLVELRETVSGAAYERKAALLYKDGSTTVTFSTIVPEDAYYIVVWHRNHMPVMSASAHTLPVISYDFTLLSNLYGHENTVPNVPAINLGGGIYGMIAGDVTKNGALQYSGPGNDRGAIIAKIVSETGVPDINGFTTNGYWQEDASMNSIVLYLGSGNDRSYIVNNLGPLTGTSYLNSIYTSVVPGVYTGSKEATNDGPFDIRLVESYQSLAIDLVTNEYLENGLADNIQFTLAWKAEDTEIADILNTLTSDFMLAPQGEAYLVNGVMHRVYVSVTPVDLPQEFVEGDQVTVMSFVNTSGQSVSGRLWIADDDFTNENNAMYYVSVWGTDFTGTILSLATGLNEIPESGSVSIYPNPVMNGMVNIGLNLEEMQDVTITLMDMQGKMIFSNSILVNAGFTVNPIEMKNLEQGVYFIKVKANKLNTIEKLLVKQKN